MRKQLGQMLIEAGAIDEATLRTALADQRRWGRPLGRTLVELRLIREEDLVRVLGQQLGLPSVDLDKVNIPSSVTDLVPGSLAFQHNIMPFAQPMKFLDVAMLDPTNLGIVDELRIRTQLNIRPYLAGPKMIERALIKYYGSTVGSTPDYEIPIEAYYPPSAPRAKSQTEERESISIGDAKTAELRDGLRPFPQQPPQPERRPMSHPARGHDSLVPVVTRDQEIEALQQRVSKLEALVARDEDVLRKLLALLIEKGLATRDEIVERLG